MAEADEKRILKVKRCVVHSISGNSVNIVKDEDQEKLKTFASTR